MRFTSARQMASPSPGAPKLAACGRVRLWCTPSHPNTGQYSTVLLSSCRHSKGFICVSLEAPPPTASRCRWDKVASMTATTDSAYSKSSTVQYSQYNDQGTTRVAHAGYLVKAQELFLGLGADPDPGVLTRRTAGAPSRRRPRAGPRCWRRTPGVPPRPPPSRPPRSRAPARCPCTPGTPQARHRAVRRGRENEVKGCRQRSPATAKSVTGRG